MPEELLPMDGPARGVLIDHDMSVVPRCGSCLEPLFTQAQWLLVCRGADHYVGSNQWTRDEALEALVALIQHMFNDHPCPLGAYIIYEEEEL